MAGLAIGSTRTVPVAEAARAQTAGPARGLTATMSDTAVGPDRRVAVRLTCRGQARCSGTVRLVAAGAKKAVKVTTARQQVRVAPGATRTVQFTVKRRPAARIAAGASARVKVEVRGAWGTRRTGATLRPATTQLTVATTRAQVATTRTFTVIVRCTAATTCRGTLRTRLGTTGAARTYVVPSGARKDLALTLTAAQYARVTSTGSVAALRVSATAPERIAASAYLTLVKATAVKPTAAPTPTQSPTPTDPEPVYSVAYKTRNWTPSVHDTCSAALHAAYNVTGPDGKVYPSWHPAQVIDPATGQSCTFGHEHGADPASSDIHDWVTNHLAATGAEDRAGIPFGFIS